MKIRLKELVTLIAVVCFGVPILGATGNPAAELHLLRPGAAVADLDGDHVPDVVSGTETGHSKLGYSYRVDVNLSSSSPSELSVLSDEPEGINIEAIDIDGDNDLDLVITSRFRHRLVGIWINDGKGHFTRDDPAKYASTVLRRSSTLKPPNRHEPRSANTDKRRPSGALVREPGLLPRPPTAIARPLNLPFVQFLSTFSAQLRAPPLYL